MALVILLTLGLSESQLDERAKLLNPHQHKKMLKEHDLKKNGPSSFTCDCKLAQKARKFSSQLEEALRASSQCKHTSNQQSSSGLNIDYTNVRGIGAKEALVGRQHEFVIEARNETRGLYLNGGDLFWWAKLTSPKGDIYPVEIHESKPGLHLARYTLYEEGEVGYCASYGGA